MFKRLATLLVGIALIGIGVFLFTAPGGSIAMQWLTKLWPAFLILAGLVRVFGHLIDRHPRSPVGGMMVVAVGGILLAANFRGERSILLLFGQYWFFLLLAFIVGRVLRQYTHRVADGKRVSAFSAGAIFVMVLLAGGGLASNYLVRHRERFHGFEFKLGQLGFWGSRFDVENDGPQQFALAPDSRLRINDFRGDVQISTLAGSLPTARLIHHIRANNQQEANQAASNIHLQITPAGLNLQFAVTADAVANDFTGTLMLTLPTGQIGGVEISNASGSVKLDGLRGNHAIRNSNGLEVKNNSGDVTVENPQGSVELSAIQGNVSVTDSRREVSLGEIRGSMTVSANGGNIHIGESTGPLKIRAQNAQIEVQSISRDPKFSDKESLVSIEDTANSRISLSEIQGNAHINAERSRIEAESIAGNLLIKTSSQRVQVNQVDGALKINAENSSIEVEEAMGSAEIETTEDVTVQGFRGAMTVTTTSGAINLSTDEKLAGTIRATSHRGRIRIALPEDSDFKLDAGSERGHVRMRGFDNEQASRKQRQLTFNQGMAATAPSIFLRSVNGDIELQSAGLALASRERQKEK